MGKNKKSPHVIIYEDSEEENEFSEHNKFG